MSHHSGFSFHAVDPRNPELERQLPSAAIAALVRAQGLQPRPGARERHIHGLTRSDWLKSVAATLLDAAGDFESLRFFSEQHETHREFVPLEAEVVGGEASDYGNDLRVTLFDPRDCAAIAAEIDRLVAWCAAHVAETYAALDFDNEATVLQAIHHTRAQDWPTPDDEGQGARTFFCLLKGVRQGLLQAQADGLCALYVNDQFCQRSWYRDHLSRPGLGGDGALHETRTLAAPPASPRPRCAAPPPQIAVEPARLHAMPRIARPAWAEHDDLRRLFDAQEALLRDGQVVWGATIQVNQMLFIATQGKDGLPGEVVYDPAGRLSPQGLVDAADELFNHRGRESADPERQAFGAYLADELERAFGRRAPVYGDYPLLASTTVFSRPALPDGWLAERAIPLVVSPAHPGMVLPLHHSLWPEEVVGRWRLAHAQGRYAAREDPNPPPPPDPALQALEVAKQYLDDVHNQDLVTARLWLEKAARLGNAEAARLLREYEMDAAPTGMAGRLARFFKR
jgi:hypothetical protein